MGDEQVATLIADLTRRGLSIATAESLTGGGLVARLVDVPGASHVVRGGVCTYAVDTKASVLGVSESRLTLTGPVDEQVARQMAVGVRSLFGASIGLSTTGVAGPGPADGFPAGTVHIACAHPAGVEHRLLHLEGDRAQVRAGAIDAALTLLRDVLDFSGVSARD
ncbi:nicotinamide-nucleotide amidohydrolase family protein [uncultured Actinomyces sp.]|uniref:CinA family protein n=1 Tax=uncultured Actinomyces sp. TaxID=249061 RepID=UPI0028E67E79|nr:nicotinamide-nucleotide amidohydrolase family protein [uncultured Actinomyces sp.]